MCEFMKPKKLTFENDMCLFLKLQIKPLLSRKVERQKNLHIDIIKFEFFKLYMPQAQHIKADCKNMEKVKNDFVSDAEVAAELGTDYAPLCSLLTYDADIKNAKHRILERRNNVFIQNMLRIFCLYKFYLI